MMRTVIFTIVLLLLACLSGSLMYAKHSSDLVISLESKLGDLLEKEKAWNKEKSLACDSYVDELFYLHCSDSISPSYVTCFCTSMCLEDYSVTMTNRSTGDCTHRRSVKRDES